MTCQSAGDIHNIIWVGFCKATQISGLYNGQLEKERQKDSIAAFW